MSIFLDWNLICQTLWNTEIYAQNMCLWDKEAPSRENLWTKLKKLFNILGTVNSGLTTLSLWVQVWFNNRRAKLRKNQKSILRNKHSHPTKDNLDMKTLVEAKNIFILQEHLGDGLFWCRQKFVAHTGQDIPLSLLILATNHGVSIYNCVCPPQKGCVLLQFVQKAAQSTWGTGTHSRHWNT